MDELELLEHARASVWSAEKALRLTLAPGIGWSVVDDLVRAQQAITGQIEAVKKVRRDARPTITPRGLMLNKHTTKRPQR